jgi:L-cysteine desulfidase
MKPSVSARDAAYLAILHEELVPVTGCTEPGSLAFAAATARFHLGTFPDTCQVLLSGNLIKNVRAVAIAGTGGLVGIEPAVIAGLVSGRTDLGTNLLGHLEPGQSAEIRARCGQGLVEVKRLVGPDPLHLILKAAAGGGEVLVELRGTHDHIVRIEKDGRTLYRGFGDPDKYLGTLTDRSVLNVADIVDFARTVDLGLVRDRLALQIELNSAIADTGMSGQWGVGVGPVLAGQDAGVLAQIKARTAAASEARMAGCPLPVVTNSGSGNQGIAASVPVVTYARLRGIGDEALYRALVVANLLTIHQKTPIGRLSGFCGVVSATCAAGAGIAFLNGATTDQIGQAITNTLANVAGIICDGAKPACGSKIASSLDAAFLGQQLALGGRSYQPGQGIVQQDVEKTIAAVGRLAREGMGGTDLLIHSLMEG